MPNWLHQAHHQHCRVSHPSQFFVHTKKKARSYIFQYQHFPFQSGKVHPSYHSYTTQSADLRDLLHPHISDLKAFFREFHFWSHL